MLAFVICGIEHGGTTLVSDLFRQVPHVDSGFETGVLLSPTPCDFIGEKPYAEWIWGGWEITADELAECCQAPSFDEFYVRLAARSRCIGPECRSVFDKTPRYLAHLASCLEKVQVPFVVTYKYPRSIVFSDFTRAGSPDFDAWFEAYADPKLGYMRHLYANFHGPAAQSPRVFRIGLETLCLQPRAACEALFAHCGERFELRYLLLQNLRYHHTRATTISPRIPFEYLETFSQAQLLKIERHFAELDSWFYM